MDLLAQYSGDEDDQQKGEAGSSEPFRRMELAVSTAPEVSVALYCFFIAKPL